MTGFMERIRVTFDIPDSVRRALLIYAAEHDTTVGAVIAEMTRDYLPEHVKQAEHAIESGRVQLRTKGRPPKKPKE